MADQTVTTALNMTQVIANGLADGDTLTINRGGVVTIDQTPTVIPSNIVQNDGGQLIIDGENIASGTHIGFCRQQGGYGEIHSIASNSLFQVRGGWYNLGTTNGANDQTFDLTAYWADGIIDIVPAIWVETGRRLDFDTVVSTVAPEVGDMLYATNDLTVYGKIIEVQSTYLVVRFLTGTLADNDPIHVQKVVDNVGPELQRCWTAQVNNASGDIQEAGVYQVFGNAYQRGSDQRGVFGNDASGFVFYGEERYCFK